MRIAIICPVIWPFVVGGSELRNYEIAKRLVKMGHEVHIYGAKWWEGSNNIDLDGIKIHGLVRFYDTKYSFKNIILSFKIFFNIFKEDFDIIDVIHFSYPDCFSMKILSVIRRKSFILTWHQYFGIKYLIVFSGIVIGSMFYILEKFSLFIAKNNIVVSNRIKKDLIKHGMKSKNIFISPNGVDINLINYSKPLNKKYDIIYVGRLVYQKRVDLLVESISYVKSTIKSVKLCIIGSGEELNKLKEIAKKLKLEDNIDFIGEINDHNKIFSYMKASKIFVLPSRFEGFPLTALEANACGLPIITTSDVLNRTKDFISNNGLISEPSPKNLSEKIIFLLKNEKKRKEMGDYGRIKTKKYDWDKITYDLEKYYKILLKNLK